MPETALIWTENCVMAGRAVSQNLVDERGESDDWFRVELTEDEAEYYDQQKMGPFGAKVAATIREMMS
jgi:hypothetical protein